MTAVSLRIEIVQAYPMLESMPLKQSAISIPFCSSQWTAPATPLPDIMMPLALQFGSREPSNIPGSLYPLALEEQWFPNSIKAHRKRGQPSYGFMRRYYMRLQGEAVFPAGRVESGATQVRHRSTLHSLSRSFTPMNNHTR